MSIAFWRMEVTVLFSLLILVGCSNQNLVTDNYLEGRSLEKSYEFTNLHVSFDTKTMKDALVSKYDEKVDDVEVIYEDKRTGVFLHGDAAMEKLDDIFNEMHLTAEMDDEDLLKVAARAFEMVEYTTFRMMIKFKGYEEKKFTLSK